MKSTYLTQPCNMRGRQTERLEVTQRKKEQSNFINCDRTDVNVKHRVMLWLKRITYGSKNQQMKTYCIFIVITFTENMLCSQ